MPRQHVDTTNHQQSATTRNRSQSKLVHHNFSLTEVRGNLFTCSTEYALAHCVGADFKMTRRIATQFRKQFCNQQFLLSQLKSKGEVAVLQSHGSHIFYLVSKEKSSHKPTFPDLVTCLENLRKIIDILGIKKLAMPRIASGLDGMNWYDVKQAIYSTLQGLDLEIKNFYDWKSSSPQVCSTVASIPASCNSATTDRLPKPPPPPSTSYIEEQEQTTPQLPLDLSNSKLIPDWGPFPSMIFHRSTETTPPTPTQPMNRDNPANDNVITPHSPTRTEPPEHPLPHPPNDRELTQVYGGEEQTPSSGGEPPVDGTVQNKALETPPSGERNIHTLSDPIAPSLPSFSHSVSSNTTNTESIITNEPQREIQDDGNKVAPRGSLPVTRRAAHHTPARTSPREFCNPINTADTPVQQPQVFDAATQVPYETKLNNSIIDISDNEETIPMNLMCDANNFLPQMQDPIVKSLRSRNIETDSLHFPSRKRPRTEQ
ncbi:hypothetical protein B566_EDAN017617 [Ephemera danica]|nr:hypothetical protein B566_EDAN017617 [Ephemera danica]